MKVSRDRAREWPGRSTVRQDIARQVSLIKQTGANCVALATPYDAEFLPFLKMWVDEARRQNLAVWFRGNWSAWEGWFGYTGGLSMKAHLQQTRQFILDNPDLFQDGDIFTPCPECENGGILKGRTGETYNIYRQFLRDQYQTAGDAFNEIDKNVEVNWFSMSGGVAKAMLDQTTIDAIGGVVTIDHYTKDADGMEEFITYFKDTYNAKVILGEFGAPIPDLNGTMDEQQQADFIDEIMSRMYKHRDTIHAISYWVLTEGSTTIVNDDNTPRLAVQTLKKYFSPATVTGKITNTLGDPIEGIEIVSSNPLNDTTTTNKAGQYTLSILPETTTLTLNNSQYKPQSRSLSLSPGDNQTADFVLEPQNPGIFYRLRLFLKDLVDQLFKN
jgi:hypothetical protein